MTSATLVLKSKSPRRNYNIAKFFPHSAPSRESALCSLLPDGAHARTENSCTRRKLRPGLEPARAPASASRRSAINPNKGRRALREMSERRGSAQPSPSIPLGSPPAQRRHSQMLSTIGVSESRRWGVLVLVWSALSRLWPCPARLWTSAHGCPICTSGRRPISSAQSA